MSNLLDTLSKREIEEAIWILFHFSWIFSRVKMEGLFNLFRIIWYRVSNFTYIWLSRYEVYDEGKNLNMWESTLNCMIDLFREEKILNFVKKEKNPNNEERFHNLYSVSDEYRTELINLWIICKELLLDKSEEYCLKDSFEDFVNYLKNKLDIIYKFKRTNKKWYKYFTVSNMYKIVKEKYKACFNSLSYSLKKELIKELDSLWIITIYEETLSHIKFIIWMFKVCFNKRWSDTKWKLFCGKDWFDLDHYLYNNWNYLK